MDETFFGYLMYLDNNNHVVVVVIVIVVVQWVWKERGIENK